MVEVFYGTSVSEQQPDEKTEYYTLAYMFVPPESFVVMQLQAWRVRNQSIRCAIQRYWLRWTRKSRPSKYTVNSGPFY
jgi:hypothetical protein